MVISDEAVRKIIMRNKPILDALADESRYGCWCPRCSWKREERRILEELDAGRGGTNE